MKRKNSFLRRLLRKPAILVVTLWARIAYRKGMEAAEQRRLRMIRESASGNCIIYVAADPWRKDHLRTYDKVQFKAEKRVYGVAARLLTMNTLARNCYYHTQDRWGRNGLTKESVRVRRSAFIRERLRYAGLI